MFAGIVKGKGEITAVTPYAGGIHLTVNVSVLEAPFKLGESIAVDGVCLTVASIDDHTITFDVITETLSKTTLGQLKVGSQVNLEQSMQVGDRIDGHFVQGHVDDMGEVMEVIDTDQEYKLWLQVPEALRVYITPRGSVAINGVSLTVAEVIDDRFAIALIPTTLELTNLGSLKAGSKVNIETDMIARQIVRYLQTVKA